MTTVFGFGVILLSTLLYNIETTTVCTLLSNTKSKKSLLFAKIVLSVGFTLGAIISTKSMNGAVKTADLQKSNPETCPIYSHLPDDLSPRTTVVTESYDFSAYDCIKAGNTLWVGPPYSKEWIETTESDYKKLDYEYYYLKCTSPKGKEETVRVIPKTRKPLPDDKNPSDVNVIVLLFDAISREKFKHLFPKTTQLLEMYANGQASNYSGAIYNRYNVNGYNSHPNKVTMYLGGNKQDSNSSLWDYALDRGYLVTHLDGECGNETDTAETKNYDKYPLGSIVGLYANNGGNPDSLNYLFPGSLYCDQRSRKATSPRSFYNDKKLIASDTTLGANHLFFGQKASFDVELDYIKEVMRIHPKKKHFVTATFLETHQKHWNLPSFDKSVAEFLEIINDEFPNTSVIAMSDHGLHYGQEYDRDIGRIHARLPLFFPLLPKSFNEDAIENLHSNSDKPASHFDFHETIKNILDMKNYECSGQFGKSLISNQVGYRTCKAMGIPMSFCLCF